MDRFAIIFQKIDSRAGLVKAGVQFFKFGIVGFFNSCFGLGIYYIFLWLGCHYLTANIASWIFSVFNAFYWNNKYVFKGDVFWWKALVKTYISYGISFVSGTCFLYALIEWCGKSELIAPIYMLLLTAPMNFLLNKFWTFKSRSQ